MSAIAVDLLSKRYGRGTRAVDALRGVSLQVERGEIFGLLGRNGAGKTTLVKILLDLVRPTAGSATIGGQSARAVAARQPIGYLPEDHRFPGYQTATSAIRFYGAMSGLSRAVCSRRAAELLEMVQLRDAARRKVRSFSKGMKQRLGLAQALVHDPGILLLDEPTDGVDPVGRAEIRDVLIRLKGEGKTIFLNSHLLSEVEQVCDRVGILDRGALVREGTIGQLTATELVYEVGTDRDVDPETVEALRGIVPTVEQPRADRLELHLRDAAGVDAVVDLLRGRRYGVRHIGCKKRSLEQAFLDVVEGAGATPDGGAR